MFEIIENSINTITDTLMQGNLNSVANIDSVTYSCIDNKQKSIVYQPMEHHRFFEIAISLSGTFVMQISKEYFYMHENQLCIIGKNIPHRIGWCLSSEKASVVLWITVSGSIIRIHTTTYNPDRTYYQSFGFDVTCLNDFLLHEILREMNTREKNYVKITSIHIASFLQLLLRRMNTVQSGKQSDWRNKIIEEVKLYINQHLHTKLNLNQISDTVSISPNYLSTLFKQITGQTLTEYIREVKLQRAGELLIETDEKISVIAEQLGFYDQFHFSRAYKRYTGLSPSNYRSVHLSPQLPQTTNGGQKKT